MVKRIHVLVVICYLPALLLCFSSNVEGQTLQYFLMCGFGLLYVLILLPLLFVKRAQLGITSRKAVEIALIWGFLYALLWLIAMSFDLLRKLL